MGCDGYKDDTFTVVPLNMFPSELKEGSTNEDVELGRQRIRDLVLTKQNEQIVKADADRPDDDNALALRQLLASTSIRMLSPSIGNTQMTQ